MKNYSKEWICTDPDNNQYGRMISKGVYEFKEFDRDNYEINLIDYPNKENFIDSVFDNDEFWQNITVFTKHYSKEQIENHISAYYDSIDEIESIYGEDSEWIIAECIFEQESGLY